MINKIIPQLNVKDHNVQHLFPNFQHWLDVSHQDPHMWGWIWTSNSLPSTYNYQFHRRVLPEEVSELYDEHQDMIDLNTNIWDEAKHTLFLDEWVALVRSVGKFRTFDNANTETRQLIEKIRERILARSN